MFCPRCGTWTSDDSARCPLCGVALRADAGPAESGPPPPGYVVWGAAANVAPVVVYGGFARRLFGAIVDSLVLFFPTATVRVVLGLSPGNEFLPESLAWWIAIAFELGLGWIYAALLMRSSARATLGMQVMDLQITDLRGERVTFARASWRYLAQILTLVSLGVGYLLQFVTPRRQTLHDIVSSTVVVRARHAPAPLAPVMGMVP